ncbi:MAG: hypothetical protein IPJ29_14535 [Chitinophagaceae bacterium]|nr:hypothetical protein [Chitinophagaceae bacterium]
MKTKQLKKNWLVTVLLTSVVTTCFAQNPPDTAWGSWPQQEYYTSILDAPVVTGATTAVTITPTGQKLCFDKRVNIKSLLSTGPVEQCIYLNTKEGYVGILPPARTGGDLCTIKTEDEKFNFFVIGLKGNAYTFKNTRKNGSIEHLVSTGNTQTHQLNMPSNSVQTFHKKTERRGYCGDKIKTWAYKHDNPSSPVYFIFGKTFPDAINVSSSKYIGYSGVGYQFTDKGLFIIMEMESSSFGCKITELEEVSICFDPAPFKIAEDEFYTNALLSLQRERDKIEADEAKIGSSDCSSQQMAVINFRKEQLRLQGVRLNTSQQGNTYQDLSSQQAMGQMLDHVAITKQTILENEVKICQAERRAERASSETSRQRYQQRISCLQSQNGQLQNLEVQLKALDIQYASEPGKAFAEKSKKFMQGLPRGCN